MIGLIQTHIIGDFVLWAFTELARYEREEQHNEERLCEALQSFEDYAEELEQRTTKKNPIQPDHRDALLIAVTLLWCGHKVINAAPGGAMHMRLACESLKKLFGRKTITHPDTDDEQNLWDWPSDEQGDGDNDDDDKEDQVSVEY